MDESGDRDGVTDCAILVVGIVDTAIDLRIRDALFSLFSFSFLKVEVETGCVEIRRCGHVDMSCSLDFVCQNVLRVS